MQGENPNPVKVGRRSFSGWLMLVMFILGGLILPKIKLSWREPTSLADPSSLKPSPKPEEFAEGPPPEGEFYARAAQIAYKSVVNIDRTQQVKVRGPFGNDLEEQQSHGSGVIIDSSGYILTNEHVVGSSKDQGNDITVTLTSGRQLHGTIVGSDHIADVALIHVEDRNLPAIIIGGTKTLVPGQMAVALGNPFGFQFTVTHGVISALGRPVSTRDGRIYPDLIQHDALINPGNSGGALINMKGQLIGINTLVYSQAQGIGFAIPIDTAMKAVAELRKYGKIKRAWIGIAPVTNTSQLSQRFELPDVEGVIVAGVYPGSPADDAGLIRGDIILMVGAKQVKTDDEFKAAESKLAIGKRVRITFLRGNQKGEMSITVGEAP